MGFFFTATLHIQLIKQSICLRKAETVCDFIQRYLPTTTAKKIMRRPRIETPTHLELLTIQTRHPPPHIKRT